MTCNWVSSGQRTKEEPTARPWQVEFLQDLEFRIRTVGNSGIERAKRPHLPELCSDSKDCLKDNEASKLVTNPENREPERRRSDDGSLDVSENELR